MRYSPSAEMLQILYNISGTGAARGLVKSFKHGGPDGKSQTREFQD